MFTENILISILITISVILLLIDTSFAGGDGFPGRRRSGGSRVTQEPTVETAGEFPTTSTVRVDGVTAPRLGASSDEQME